MNAHVKHFKADTLADLRRVKVTESTPFYDFGTWDFSHHVAKQLYSLTSMLARGYSEGSLAEINPHILAESMEALTTLSALLSASLQFEKGFVE